MKRNAKKFARGVAASAAAAGLVLGLAGCSAEPTIPLPDDDFDPMANENVEVYGPPEYFNGEGEDGPYGIEDPYDDFDPSTNEVQTVYGPPEWFEDEAATNE